MPEVKWAPLNVLSRTKQPTYPIPVLTLDDLEAWLENRLNCISSTPTVMSVERAENMLLRELLTQVQAWKEGK